MPRLKHGHTGVGYHSRTYTAWISMRKRCYDPKASGHSAYAIKGITVCARWRNSFEAFLADMGACPDGLELDRINNNGNYEPGNCRWTTRYVQTRNTSKTRMIEFDGLKMCLRDWERHLGIGHGTLWRRLDRGETIPFALRGTK